MIDSAILDVTFTYLALGNEKDHPSEKIFLKYCTTSLPRNILSWSKVQLKLEAHMDFLALYIRPDLSVLKTTLIFFSMLNTQYEWNAWVKVSEIAHSNPFSLSLMTTKSWILVKSNDFAKISIKNSK